MPLDVLFPETTRPVIGMVHLGPLPGAPRYGGDLSSVVRRAVADARALVDGGVDGLMMENFFDVPFFKDRVGPQTIAAMTRAALAVREAIGPGTPMGVNVLRNDGCAALAIASAVDAAFVRVNVLSGAMLTDQGIIEGAAAKVMRYRQSLDAGKVQVWADVRVKHAAALAVRSLKDEVEDLCHRALADAVIVSGSGTGRPTASRDAGAVKEAAGRTPVLIGSGVTADQLEELRPVADGFIVGSGFKQDGQIGGPVDVTRVRSLMSHLRTFP